MCVDSLRRGSRCYAGQDLVRVTSPVPRKYCFSEVPVRPQLSILLCCVVSYLYCSGTARLYCCILHVRCWLIGWLSTCQQHNRLMINDLLLVEFSCIKGSAHAHARTHCATHCDTRDPLRVDGAHDPGSTSISSYVVIQLLHPKRCWGTMFRQ